MLYGKEEYVKNIMAVDLKSEDQTKDILKKMSKDYECLQILSWKECKDLIDNIDEN